MSAPAATVENFVIEGLRELVAEPDAVAPDTPLQDLEIDSLDMVELGQMIEEEYGVKLERSQFENVIKVGDVLAVIISVVGG